ncbi:hypothetical protein GCM10023107_70310 [Actinoplanes octamycinicus]|nr:hypothetical protein Aoc01nite_27200 [Actinoplanes octamycinicus]
MHREKQGLKLRFRAARTLWAAAGPCDRLAPLENPVDRPAVPPALLGFHPEGGSGVRVAEVRGQCLDRLAAVPEDRGVEVLEVVHAVLPSVRDPRCPAPG